MSTGEENACEEPDPPQETSQLSLAGFSSVAFFALPLIAAEIFQNVFWALASVILTRELGGTSEFILSPFFQSGVVAGLASVITGHVLDLAPWAGRKLAMLVSVLFQLAGFALLAHMDVKLADGGISQYSNSRIPLFSGIPGCFCCQFSVALLQICGRSFIVENFSPLEQTRVHQWTATFCLSASSIIRVTFGLLAREWSSHEDLNVSRLHILISVFVLAGIVVVAISACLIREEPAPAWRARTTRGVMARVETFPEFVSIALPLVVGLAPYVELALMVPLEAASLAAGGGSSFCDGFGFGFVSLACASAVAVAAAWAPHQRGSVVWALLLSAVVVSTYDYDHAPPSMLLCLAVTPLTGIGLCALSAGPWAAFAQCAPRVGINGVIGVIVGLVTMFQVGTVVAVRDDQFMRPRVIAVCLVVAALAALEIPNPPPPPDPAYASIDSR
jgi:hypothetical protein